MLSVELIDRASVKLAALPEQIRSRLRVAIIHDGKDLVARVRAKLSGAVLHIRSGALINSIRSEMVENSTSIYGRVYSSGVPYARIHEFGGQTKPHMIRPVKAKALHFMMGGEDVFAQSVMHPGSKIPARSYLRSSLTEMKAQIEADMVRAAKPVWN